MRVRLCLLSVSVPVSVPESVAAGADPRVPSFTSGDIRLAHKGEAADWDAVAKTGVQHFKMVLPEDGSEYAALAHCFPAAARFTTRS